MGNLNVPGVTAMKRRLLLFLSLNFMVLMFASWAGAWTRYDLGTEFTDPDINSGESIAIGSNDNKYIVFGGFPEGSTTQRLYLKVLSGNSVSARILLPGPN